jgi:hypothetical protein
MLYIIIGLIILTILIIFLIYKKEFFQGAIIQMQARGSIDHHLTGGVRDICGGDPLCLYDEPVKKSQNMMFQ